MDGGRDGGVTGILWCLRKQRQGGVGVWECRIVCWKSCVAKFENVYSQYPSTRDVVSPYPPVRNYLF